MRGIEQRRLVSLLLSAALLAACAAAAPALTAPVPAQAPAAGSANAEAADPDSIAAALIRASLPGSPRQLQFGWALDEAGSRFSGRGVARLVAPSRFRLDLFGPRGETYLAAALVDGAARVPPSVMERFRLPSPALLWAAVGVVSPPSGWRLASASDEGGRVVLRYTSGSDESIEYRANGSRLASVRRLKGSAVQESVDLERGGDGNVRSARYRDWVAYRNLNLTLESSADVASFTDDVWTPPGTDR
jgi:hypothetical protein